MPIITIFSATGMQGSTILNAVLADGKYTPRGVSRSLDSDASKALIAKGVEVGVGNLFDKESLKKAIRGSEAVLGVTDFYDSAVFTAEDRTGSAEITQGKNLVDAAKEEGVKFFIWRSCQKGYTRTFDSARWLRFLFHAKMGAFPDTPVPNPDLVALGVKFGSVEEFKTKIVPRFA
ncbi:NmrA-like family-domain-containing protein [Mycena polygramma]|nr:NmrA-like family-domain-containing protein [Mycena polygramma]